MFNNKGISAHESQSIFSLIDACHSVSSKKDLLLLVYSKLWKVLPHDAFACGIGGVSNLRVDEYFNVSFPHSYLRRVIADGYLRSPIAREWSQTRQPVFFDALSPSKEMDARWRETFNDYGFSNIVGHGLADLGKRATSYFSFAGLKRWGPYESFVIQMIVPHLHVALTNIYNLNPRPAEVSLSRREREVLDWVCLGKTNAEIGLILGISPWTAKIHVKNLMAKLEVTTREYAVAKAFGLGILDLA